MKFMTIPAIVACLVFAACGGKSDSAAPAGKTEKSADTHAPGDGHTHAPGDGHDHGHGHTGEKFDLGTLGVAGVTIKAVQIGKAEAGKETTLEVTVEPEKDSKAQPAPKVGSVRAWFGDAEGAPIPGAAKALAAKGEDDYDVHLAALKDLPAAARVWIEADLGDGLTARASFVPKR
jgi:hypothetical protein